MTVVGPSTLPSRNIPPPSGWLTNCSKPSRGTVRPAIWSGIGMGAMVRNFTMAVICEVLTAPHSPWQNAYVERFIGSIRRECLNHVMVFHETGLRRILKDYFQYYEGC